MKNNIQTQVLTHTLHKIAIHCEFEIGNKRMRNIQRILKYKKSNGCFQYQIYKA